MPPSGCNEPLPPCATAAACWLWMMRTGKTRATSFFSASQISVPQMAMLIRHCSGIVCLPLTAEHARRLDLPLMTAHNTNTQQTAFTISIEAATGVTTGVSAADRVATVRPPQRHRPVRRICGGRGTFSLLARPGGYWERRGHTEATVDPAHGRAGALGGVLQN